MLSFPLTTCLLAFLSQLVYLLHTGVGSKVFGISLLSECLMEMSNGSQLHISVGTCFSFRRGQDNLPDAFGKLSLSDPHMLEGDFAS